MDDVIIIACQNLRGEADGASLRWAYGHRRSEPLDAGLYEISYLLRSKTKFLRLRAAVHDLPGLTLSETRQSGQNHAYGTAHAIRGRYGERAHRVECSL